MDYIERYWAFDEKNNSYQAVDAMPLSVFPTIIDEKNMSVWCRSHKRWEAIVNFKDNILKTSCGKLYTAPFVSDNSIFNYAYEVKYRADSFYIRVYSQLAATNKRQLLNNDFELDLSRKRLLMNGKEIFNDDDIKFGLCKEITSKILNTIGDNYKEEYGLKPSVSSSLTGFSLILGYLLSPFNINFYKISNHWGLNPFDADFLTLSSGNTSTAENEMFESLGIKASKAIRKMYQKNPYSVICYAAAKDLGFTDVNILRSTVTPDFYLFLKYYMISFFGGEINYPSRASLKYFVTDMLTFNSQKPVWNSIQRTLGFFFNRNIPKYIIEDGLNLYTAVSHELTEHEKKQVLHEGFNYFTHNFLLRRNNELVNIKNAKQIEKERIDDMKPFPIEEKFLELEYKAGDAFFTTKAGERKSVPDEYRWCFYVARNGQCLKEIGSEMHNCVGWGYKNAVRERRSTIVYAKFMNKYKICIEVTPDFYVRQVYGPCNTSLVGDAVKAYKEWFKEKKLLSKKVF